MISQAKRKGGRIGRLGTFASEDCARRVLFVAAFIVFVAVFAGPRAGAQNVTATVATGALPVDVAVNSVTNRIYIADFTGNSVTVIDGATNAVIATIPAGLGPIAIAVNSVTNKIYVANQNSNNLTVIDGATNATKTVPLGIIALPEHLALDTLSNKIYVSDIAANNVLGAVSVIDGATNAIIATVPTGQGYVAVNQTTNTVYVANELSNNITVIDGPSNTASTLPTGSKPRFIAVNSVMNEIYVTSATDGTVTVIDAGDSNLIYTVPTGSYALAVGVDSVTNRAYVANELSNNVTVLNGAVKTATVAVGSTPDAIAVDPITNQIYVCNFGDGTVTVIDGATNSTVNVTVGSTPYAIAVDTVTQRVYVVNGNDATVSVIAEATGTPSPTPTPTPTPTPHGSGTARFINISTRAQVGIGANILIPGFVITGPGTETLLIRGDGPSLSQFAVTGVLAQPTLGVYNGSTLIASNIGWGTNANPALIASTAAQVGAFAFKTGSADCALIVNLSAGNYTVQISGLNSSTGVALAEVYEVNSTGTRLVNISTRAMVGTGGNILIPGFVISGSGSELLLVRADGPSLTQFQVTGILAQTTLGVYSGSILVASNTGWGTSSNLALIVSTAAQVGAFAFSLNSGDSAQIVNLTSGGYTIQISGVNNSTGVALAEVYELP